MFPRRYFPAHFYPRRYYSDRAHGIFPLRYFPPRYFAPRYFAPRYFAGPSGVVPPVPPTALRVLIRGIDRSDYLSYRDTTSWNLMRSSRGTSSIPILLSPDDAFTPQVGDTIEIFDPGNTRVWDGSCEDVAVKWIGDQGWRVRTLAGVSVESLFDTAAVNKAKYAGQTAGAIITALYALSGVTRVTLGQIDDGPIVKSIEVSNIWQGMTQVAVIAGYVVYIDHKTLKLNFHPPAAIASDLVIRSRDIRWESLDYKQSRSEYRTSQQVQTTGTAQTGSIFDAVGDGIEDTFTLPVVPAYLVSIELSAGSSTTSWTPGSADIVFDPAPEDGADIRITYADNSSSVAPGVDMGIGTRTTVYTRTRTFTKDGAEQEAAAIEARFSLLPAQLMLTTDTPGIQIGKVQTIDLDYPIDAGNLLNGDWTVQELQGALVPGLDMKEEPYGHFRYTAHLINAAANAILQGDGETTDFELPEIPSDVSAITVWNGGDDPNNPLDPYGPDYPYTAEWEDGTNRFTIDPAPPEYSSIVADWTPASFAAFSGDGITGNFELPDIPKLVKAIQVFDVLPEPLSSGGGTLNPGLFTTFWGVDTKDISVDPPPPEGSSVLVRFDNGRAPDVPSFIDTWNDTLDKGSLTPPILGDEPQPNEGGGSGGPQDFLRTLWINDTTVRDDAAPHVPVYAAGTGTRILAVLRKPLFGDLTVRFNKAGDEMITVTIPSGTGVDDVLSWPLLTGSPPAPAVFVDEEVLTVDILAGDGQKFRDGIATFTVEWRS